MPLVMPDQRDADAVRNFAVKKVVRKASQIGAAEFGADRVKPSGIGSGELDEVAQLLLKFVTEDR